MESPIHGLVSKPELFRKLHYVHVTWGALNEENETHHDRKDAIDNAIGEILTNWKKFSLSSKDTKNLVEEVKQLDITEKMHAITQQKIANSLVKKVEKSEEEKRLKEAILNGFANGGGDSDDGSDDNDAGGDLGPANTNAESVQKVIKNLQFFNGG